MSSSPAIILKSKFVMPASKEFTNYVDYMDREDAKVNLVNKMNETEEFKLYHSYMDYMGDEKKQGALFSNQVDYLNLEEKISMKKNFKQAEKNGSPLWQDVVSFDNDWLEKQGLFDSKTGELDELQMKEAIRESMNEMLAAEKMNHTAVWTGSIHYNTDNIHVHIATVEPVPTREKKWRKNEETGDWNEEVSGKRKQKSLDKMKSRIINNLMDRTNERNKINDLIRGAVKDKRESQMDLARNRKTKELFLQAINKMPDDMKQWQYGYQSVDEARPSIDGITDIYLKTYHKKEMKELHRSLDRETLVMKELYGEESDYKNYKETKLNDLKKRMGNAVIREMREYTKKERSLRKRNEHARNRKAKYNSSNQYNNAGKELEGSMKRLRYALLRAGRDYNKDRNMSEYERMLEEQERGR